MKYSVAFVKKTVLLKSNIDLGCHYNHLNTLAGCTGASGGRGTSIFSPLLPARGLQSRGRGIEIAVSGEMRRAAPRKSPNDRVVYLIYTEMVFDAIY